MSRTILGLPPREEPARPAACIAGLGNPGEAYHETRHNIGFRVIERLAVELKARAPLPRINHSLSEAEIDGARIQLIRPWTYMNLSGAAVRLALDFDELDPTRLLVICDDISLPLGALRLRRNGSGGGQRGLESIIEALGTDEFARLRCGVGPVPHGIDAADFVLSGFLAGEQDLSSSMISLASEAVRCALLEGIDRAMNLYNGRSIQTPDSRPSPE